MYVCAGHPAFARPCVGVHKSTSLMSLSLLLQLCPACLVRLTWIVFVIGGRWPYSWYLVGCCRQDLFKIVQHYIYIYIYMYINTKCLVFIFWDSKHSEEFVRRYIFLKCQWHSLLFKIELFGDNNDHNLHFQMYSNSARLMKQPNSTNLPT